MKAVRHVLALNHAQPGTRLQLGALNLKLAGEGDAPEWLELIPAPAEDGFIVGEDGRTWRNPDPQAVVDAFTRKLPVDINHASEIRTRFGEETPAIGWITQLRVEENRSIWGRIEWTARGAQIVQSREYCFLSPAFNHTIEDKRIVKLTSAAVTNQPNFDLALNTPINPDEETGMNFLEKLIAQLGLAKNAKEEDVQDKIKSLQTDLESARNTSHQPSLDKFVPRADYDKAVERATNARQKLDEIQAQAREQEIDGVIDEALDAGKITPATVEYHKAQCASEGGLERFREFLKTAPVIADASDLGERKPEKSGDTALNAEEAKVAGLFGNSAEDLEKYGTA